MKIDKTVWKETFYVALGTIFMSAIMIAIYCAITPFNLKMLYGALFGSVAAILNFFFMAYTLQKAVEINSEDDEDKAEKVKLKVKASYSIRSMVYVLSLALGLISGVFDVYTLLIPALFPTIVAKIRMFWLNKHGE
jgi:hypothetical protein